MTKHTMTAADAINAVQDFNISEASRSIGCKGNSVSACKQWSPTWDREVQESQLVLHPYTLLMPAHMQSQC